MTIGRVNIFFSLFFSTALAGSAQFVPTTRYTSKDGMFTERITCITQDAKGYMWFGTYFGVMRYDGYEWKRIELSEKSRNKVVLCIRAVGDRVYAGFGFGGGLIEIYKGMARSITLPSTFQDVNLMTTNADSSLSLMLTSYAPNHEVALWKYKEGKFEFLWAVDKQHENITAIAGDKHNRLWVGTKKGAFIIDKNKIVPFIKDTAIQSISANMNGSMMAQSVGNGYSIVRQLNADNLALTSYFKVSNTNVFPQDGNNVGTWGIQENVLVRLEENGSIFRYPFDLPRRTVTGPIFIDREQNIWLSTEAGLYKFSNLKAQSFYFDERGPTSTFILPVSSQKIITNGHALYVLNGTQLKKVLPLTDASGFLFHDSKQNIWMSHWAGKGGVSIGNFYGSKINLKHIPGHYSRFIMDSKQNIWTSSNGFTIFKDAAILQTIPIDLPEEKNVQIINFLLDESNATIWAGTTYWGVLKIKYTIDNKGKYHLHVIDRIDKSKGLADQTIRGNLFKDSKGKLWIGTRNNGIASLEENNGKYIIKKYAEKEGVTCSRINWITEHKGYIWFAACDGVYKMNDAGVVRKYNTGDGLSEDYVLHILFEADTMWAGTSEAITKIILKEDVQHPPPPVAISDVRVLGISDTALYNAGVTSLSSSQNSIGFTFTSNSFINEKKVVYKYKLEGYEQDWSLPAPGNNINYASLAPGTYTFNVMAKNAKGVWSTAPATFTFKIVLPFYRSTWFLMLMLAIIAVTIFLIRHYRIQQRLKLERLRSSIARDLHDDIGSALGSINILSRTAQRKIKSDPDAAVVVSKIGKTAQSTLESMDEIIWTINPVKEKVIDLVVRMQNFAQPLLESEGIQFTFNANAADNHKLNMAIKRNMFLIFKELIYNAIRHAQCTNVEVSLFRENKYIILEVKDNGKGIDSGKTINLRNGLNNINARASSLGGNFYVEKRKDGGTISIIKVPAV